MPNQRPQKYTKLFQVYFSEKETEMMDQLMKQEDLTASHIMRRALAFYHRELTGEVNLAK
jgi:hypothetical protein